MTKLLNAKQLSLGLLTSSVVVLGGASAAQALTLFSDRTAFNQAMTQQTLLDFEGIALPGWFVYYPSSLTQSGVTFTGSTGNLFVVDPAYSRGFYDWGSGAVLSYQRGDALTVTLPSGITAFGSDIMSFRPYASNFLITLSSGEVFDVPSFNYPNRAFFGVTSEISISSIAIRAEGEARTQLDNFVIGKANPQSVPTPALLPGLIGMGLAALRKRRAESPEDNNQR